MMTPSLFPRLRKSGCRYDDMTMRKHGKNRHHRMISLPYDDMTKVTFSRAREDINHS
jgi:hypothetical protein